jgi:hypothetical protein
MNIFYLHANPDIAARAMTDKHVVKMILESAQLLCTAHRVIDGEEFIQLSKSGARLKKWRHPDTALDELLYKSTHINHPSAIWARQSIENYKWLYTHFISLSEEYTRRYNKQHLSHKLLGDVLAKPPTKLSQIAITPMLVAITDTNWHVENNPLQSYRNYYVGEKLKTDKDTARYYEVLQLER